MTQITGMPGVKVRPSRFIYLFGLIAMKGVAIMQLR